MTEKLLCLAKSLKSPTLLLTVPRNTAVLRLHIFRTTWDDVISRDMQMCRIGSDHCAVTSESYDGRGDTSRVGTQRRNELRRYHLI